MNRPGKKFPVTVLKNDSNRDLTILKVPDELLDVIPLQLSNDVNLADNSELSLLGYPNHTAWKPIRHEFGRYVRSIVRHGVTTIEITPKIIEGNSGGPVLDRDCRVIGIARAGINAETAENQSEFIAIRSTELVNLGP